MNPAALYGFRLVGNEGKPGFAESSNLSGNNDSVGLKWETEGCRGRQKGLMGQNIWEKKGLECVGERAAVCYRRRQPERSAQAANLIRSLGER